MILRRLTANVKAQNWTAIAIEFVIVVIGVFIGTQVSNWNQARVERQNTIRLLDQFKGEIRYQTTQYGFLARLHGDHRELCESGAGRLEARAPGQRQ